MEEKDLEFLREQLSRLDEPELPPSLTAEALFARLDEGTLALPEEAPAQKERKVIPWGKSARRWLPLAACLALVLLLYRGYEVGLAKNFANGAAPQMAESYDLTASGAPDPAPDPAAYAPYNEEAAEEGEEKSLFRSAADAPMEAAEDSDLLQKNAQNSVISSAPAAPAPSPSGRPDTGSDKAPDDSLPAPEPAPDHGSSSGGSSSGKPNPPTGGGGDSHPDTGGGDEPTDPDFGVTDSGEEGPSLYKQLKGQMEEIAAQNSPDETLISSTCSSFWPDDGQTLEFTARYVERTGGKKNILRAERTFYCRIHQAEEGPWLELLYFEEKAS